MGGVEGHGPECTIARQSKNGTGERHSALRVREGPADPRNLIWVVPAKGVHALPSAPSSVEVSHLVTAIVVADGDVPSIGGLPEGLLPPDADGPPIVLAADGGARKAVELGLAPRVVIGDGDSLAAAEVAELRARGTEVLLFPAEKDESDTELALREAVARGAHRILVLGSFGGTRLDHALANVALLALPELEGRDVALSDGTSTVRLIGRADGPGELRITGASGELVSLFPLDPTVEGIVSAGLRYPLHDESLRIGPSRGLSNELVGPEARIATRRGRLLVVHTRVLFTAPAPRSSG